MFKRTTAVNKLLKLTKRKRAIYGGTSASKTYGILALLIDYAIKNKNTEISVVSESIPHLRRGAMKDFLKVMQWTGRYIDQNWNRTLLTYTFTNGSYIEFFSADSEAKLRGARRNILYINEANNLTFEAYHQLAIRTSGNIWLDWNPVAEFWGNTEVMSQPDCDSLCLTYKDNEALPQSIVDDIESAQQKALTSSYWLNWWNVYGLGQVGKIQGVVYDNWTTIDTIPTEARLVSIGLDFGFTTDPSCAIAIYKYNNSYIIDQIFYQKGMSNHDIYKAVRAYLNSAGQGNIMIVADSAEPKSIAELQSYGLKVKGANKGPDSIDHGIQLVQKQTLLVTKQSTDVIKELRGYVWATDRNGKETGDPIDHLNHGMDSMRYGFEIPVGMPNKGKYNFR